MDVASWKHTLLEFLFPAICVSCYSPGSFLCNKCQLAIPLSEPACFVCNARKGSGSICKTCRARLPHLTRVWWATLYENQSVRDALTHFKYNGNHALAETLADFIVASVKKRAQAHYAHIPARAALIAIPLHPRKKRVRGFNQSELLADHVARELQLPLLPLGTLVRVKNTSQQAKAGGRNQRIKNVEGAFIANPEYVNVIQNRTIILVDDIATTGSTLNDAARALKKAGAMHVWGLVVAKG